MGFYSEKIKNIQKNFKIDELKEILEEAKEDYQILPQFIDLIENQIDEIRKEEFSPLIIFKRELGQSYYRYTVKLLSAPLNLAKYKDRIDLERSFKPLREFSFLENERDIAIFCCEELINKYSISRERIYLVNFYDSNYERWMNSIMDEICKGISYKAKKKRSVFQKPNLSSKGYGYRVDINSGSLEKEMGEHNGILSDGRPYKVEIWSESEYIFITFFFSTEDIETIETYEIEQLLKPQLDYYKVPKEEQSKPDISIIHDESGNRLWSVTYILREM